VVHGRDNKGVGVAHNAQKLALIFPGNNGTGKTKPKQAFGLTKMRHPHQNTAMVSYTPVNSATRPIIA